MNIKQYRKERGLTQSQFADELNAKLGTDYDKAIVSRVEGGKVCFPEFVLDYLSSNIAEKPVATCADERNGSEWTTTPHDEKKCFKSAISEDVLEELKYHTKHNPFISHDFASDYGIKEVGVRAAIRELRMNHIRICSDPSHRGYWLEENGEPGDYERTVAQMKSRAFKILAVVKAMDNNQDGQLQWERELG